MSVRYSRFLAAAAFLCLLSLLSTPAGAQTVTVGGDAGEVTPANPAAWTTTTPGKIGINSGKSGLVAVAGGYHMYSGSVYLGYNAGSSGAVSITGTNSTWNNSVGFFVGYLGAGALTVASGGTLTTATLYDASLADIYGDGTINTKGLITDLDLVFDATHGSVQAFAFGTGGVVNLNLDGSSALGTGYGSTGSLRVADGLKIKATSGYLGYRPGTTTTSIVTGAGTSWTNSINLYVGYSGSHAMSVENGGTVTNVSGYVGYNAGSNGAATVTGTGSTWTNSGSLTVGSSGAGALTVASGGKVTSNGGYLGDSSGGSGAVTVTGTGSTWTNSGTLYLGQYGTNTLNVSNGGKVTNTLGYLGYNAGSSGAATVSGTGSSWNNSGVLYVGYDGAGALRAENGGTISSPSCYLGYDPGSSGTATVTGAGSTWTNSGALYVGNAGPGTGSLTVANGGTVTTGALYASDLRGDGTINTRSLFADLPLVFDATHGTGQASFGTGGTLKMNVGGTGDLGVGYNGTGTLLVADGVKVTSASGYLGYGSGSSGTATITGSGSTWTSSSLTVGRYGTGSLWVANGGTVVGGASLGANADSSGTATVTGQGSAWTSSGALSIGLGGTGTMSVMDGGRVSAGADGSSISLYLGKNAGSNGSLTVTGSGSTWTGSGALDVGYYGAGTLRVAGGGAISSFTGNLGVLTGSSGSVTVTGSGSTWTNSSDLYVGKSGTGTLTVENGGTVTTKMLYADPGVLKGDGTINTKGLASDMAIVFDAAHTIGQASFGTGGVLNLSPDSTAPLTLGYRGTGSLVVAEGVKITTLYSTLGSSVGSIGTATIAGTGSSWTTSDWSTLVVGGGGTGTLTVENGGTVKNNRCYVGNNAGSNGTVTVTGVGSTWTNSQKNYDFSVGYSGTGTLNVTNGGRVSNVSYCTVGYNAGSNGKVAVAGTGSAWTNTTNVTVGNSGVGELDVANGGMASCANGYLGYNAGSSGTAVITGSGSSWSSGEYNGGYSTGGLYVGSSGTGVLKVEDGGAVSTTTGYVGYSAGGRGTVSVTGPGSTWTNSADLYVGYSGVGAGTLTVAGGGTVSTGTLYASAADLKGDGTINARGLVSDLDIVSDATHATQAPFGTGGVLNLNLNGTGDLGVGYRATGSLRVADGTHIGTRYGYLAYSAGSSGMATVTGAGSAWTNSTTLYLGERGTGSLRVENGGAVTCGSTFYVGDYGAGTLTVASGGTVSGGTAYLGYNTGSSGTATITGPGSTWTGVYELYVGRLGSGVLTVANGGKVSTSSASHIGYSSVAGAGTATVTGAGSTWATGDLSVGGSGTGILVVSDGGTVTSSSALFGTESGSGSGAATVTGEGSTWTNTGAVRFGYTALSTLTVEKGGTLTTGSLYGSDLRGDGTINTKGLVADMTLVFDATHGPSQAVPFGTGGVLNLNLDGSGELGVGYHGTGSLRIAGGAKTTSAAGCLGYYPGSTGTAIVTGAGSTWTNSGPGHEWEDSGALAVGYEGTGTLRVADGAVVNCSGGTIAYYYNSIGTATVTGTGSVWNNPGGIDVGYYGKGTLTVGHGGKVTATSMNMNYSSALNLHVSGSGMIVLGDATLKGRVDGDCRMNLYADAFLGTGTYSPVTEYAGRTITWTNQGSYASFGGAWSNTTKTFTVLAATTSDSGVYSALTTGERLLITDVATGKRAGASFGTIGGGMLKAAVMSDISLTGLMAPLPDDQAVLDAWDFTTNFTGGQALLSFEVGAGYSDLAVWHYDGATWSTFAAPDLTYGDGAIANFAVTGFGGYALSAAKHPGDANGDGAVDVIDLGILAKNYDTAAGATWNKADFSKDGAVDVVDLGILAKNYDWAGLPAGAGLVPEPASLSLLALAGLALLRRR